MRLLKRWADHFGMIFRAQRVPLFSRPALSPGRDRLSLLSQPARTNALLFQESGLSIPSNPLDPSGDRLPAFELSAQYLSIMTTSG